MIKTIKVKKKMRLDELIKYIFDNGIEDTKYLTSRGPHFEECEVRISGHGNIKLSGYINKNTTFTVEVEEEITRKTVFEHLVILQEEYDDLKVHKAINSSINDVYSDSETWKIYALIDNDLELIWDKE